VALLGLGGVQVPLRFFSRLVGLLLLWLSGLYVAIVSTVISRNFTASWHEKERFERRFSPSEGAPQSKERLLALVKETPTNEKMEEVRSGYVEVANKVSHIEMCMQALMATPNKTYEDFTLAHTALDAAKATLTQFTEEVQETVQRLRELNPETPIGPDPSANVAQDELYNNPNMMMDVLRHGSTKYKYSRDPTLLPFTKRISAENRMEGLWKFLHDRKSSWAACFYFWIIVVIILGSIGIYGLETMPQYMKFGEKSYSCQRIVQSYCTDKNDIMRDPGCFVYPPSYIDFELQKLEFFCDTSFCYGHGKAGRIHAPRDDCSAAERGVCLCMQPTASGQG
jgi:hypothetical protein